VKKKKKKSKRKFPFITLFILSAILLWIFWNKFQDLTTFVQNYFISGESGKPSQERISEQERKNLEEILKRR
jgi:ABC-type glucose/galactose transport system permease subunit